MSRRGRRRFFGACLRLPRTRPTGSVEWRKRNESHMSLPDLPEAFDPHLGADTDASRRGFLRTAVGVLTSGIAVAATAVLSGAAAATVLTKAAIGSSLALRAPRWVRAGRLDELETNVPTPVTLRITRRDGYLETVDQQVVFLVRSETQEVRALSSSCAHLGCSVTFNREKEQFLCPCHQGVFNLDGTVASGPPPRPLDPLAVRVEKSSVLVQV